MGRKSADGKAGQFVSCLYAGDRACRCAQADADGILPCQKLDGAENNRAKEGGAGDGEYPGPDDAASDSPADRGKTTRSSDADNGAGNRVRGADGDAKCGGA